MYDEPDTNPEDRPSDPKEKAKRKSDEFRMFAEQAAVFEGVRKFDAQLRPGLDTEIARECQQGVGRLEKARLPEMPVIKPESVPLATRLLCLPDTAQLSTNDYHVNRRPGEVLVLRWLAGEQLETFYARLQAHFDAAMKQFRDDERQALAWKQEPRTQQYLEALDAIDVKMAERYLRPIMRQHPEVLVLSTQAADEMDITYLCETIMNIDPAALVGKASAPPDQPSDSEKAWFFKLFALRGTVDGVERMMFFTFLQKSDDPGEWAEDQD